MNTFSRSLLLMGIVTGLGFAKVTQQTTIWLAAYELGRRSDQFHELENDTLWLKTQVVALQSPAHLAKAMRQERQRLVASLDSTRDATLSGVEWVARTELPVGSRLAQVAKVLTTPSRDFRSE